MRLDGKVITFLRGDVRERIVPLEETLREMRKTFVGALDRSARSRSPRLVARIIARADWISRLSASPTIGLGVLGDSVKCVELIFQSTFLTTAYNDPSHPM